VGWQWHINRKKNTAYFVVYEERHFFLGNPALAISLLLIEGFFFFSFFLQKKQLFSEKKHTATFLTLKR